MIKSNRAGRVGVIGGGLGGLAAACTLAARGHDVVLFERNSWLGGKAAVLEADGFRFDMGPTILTLPSVLARIFAEAGRRLDDYLELVRIDPQWRSFFADGTTLDLRADIDQMVPVSTLSPRGPARAIGVSWNSPPGCITSRIASFSGARLVVCATCSTSRPPSSRRCCATCSPCTRAVGGRDGAHACARRACRPDARSFHPVRGLGSGRIARGAVRHRPHADQ